MAGYCVYVDRAEGVDFVLGADAAGHDELAIGDGAEALSDFERETLHQAFAIDVRVEEGCDVGLERRNRFFRSEGYLGFPAFDGDFAATRVDAGDYAVCAYGCG